MAQTCAHEACRCTRPYDKATFALSSTPVDPNAEYCSPRCETQAGGTPTDDGCECGHAACTPQNTRDIPPMQ